MHTPQVEDFFLLYCRFKEKFLVAIGLTTLREYDKIEIQCRHCGHRHVFTMLSDGQFKVVTR